MLRCFYNWIVVLTSCPATSRIRPCCTWHHVMDTLGLYASACLYNLKQTRHETRMPSAARGGFKLLSSIHGVLALTVLCSHELMNSDAQRPRQMQLWRNRTKSKLCDAPRRHHCHCTKGTRSASVMRRQEKAIKSNGTSARLSHYGTTAQTLTFRLTRPSL